MQPKYLKELPETDQYMSSNLNLNAFLPLHWIWENMLTDSFSSLRKEFRCSLLDTSTFYKSVCGSFSSFIERLVASFLVWMLRGSVESEILASSCSTSWFWLSNKVENYSVTHYI